ncbi:MAG: hypothetical protein VXX39_05655, partial [Candidatus Thermoplasmatota archaeon]|nr:hypothetical protein [Candidatus Thermoplasmatota archaeon]
TGQWRSYDPADPVFHRYYIKLINSLRQSGIPQMKTVEAMYVGYASHSLGERAKAVGIDPVGMDVEELEKKVSALENLEKSEE